MLRKDMLIAVLGNPIVHYPILAHVQDRGNTQNAPIEHPTMTDGEVDHVQ